MGRILALAFLILSSPIYALDIKGISIGDTWNPEKLDAALGWNKAPTGDAVIDVIQSHCDELSCFGYTDIGPVLADVSIEQKEGKVSSIIITFPADFFPQISRAMSEKFGKPTKVESKEVQNLFGAKFQDHKFVWISGNQNLFLERYFNVNRSWIRLYVPEKKTEKIAL